MMSAASSARRRIRTHVGGRLDGLLIEGLVIESARFGQLIGGEHRVSEGDGAQNKAGARVATWRHIATTASLPLSYDVKYLTDKALSDVPAHRLIECLPKAW